MDFNLNISSITNEGKTKQLDPKTIYDVLIIGGGPAGLTACVYCMRKGLSTGLIAGNIGGQVAETAGIENYMGYRYVEGIELVEKFREQIKQFTVGYNEKKKVTAITTEEIKKVYLEDNSVFQARSLIIASGKSPKKLNIPGEKEFTGKGVAFCAICDAPIYRGQKVAVVGGGNSGVEAAIDLAKIAKHVTLIQHLDELTADKVLIDKINEYKNVDYLFGSQVLEIKGDLGVRSAQVSDKKGNNEEIEIDGIFIEIGLDPNTQFVENILHLNDQKEIIVDCKCNTNVPGIFAAGDATFIQYKQIIIAAGEGAKAALSAHDYILKEN